MKTTIERKVPRINFRMPVEVRLHGKLNNLKETCISENVSANGISFVTGIPLSVGNRIDMIFVMPRELTEKFMTPFKYTGKVLRVRRVEGPEERYQVAASLLWLTSIGPIMSKRYSDDNKCETAA